MYVNIIIFKDKYIKFSKDLGGVNVTKNKIMSYYNNLKETEKNVIKWYLSK
jgi:hypothetical protein